MQDKGNSKIEGADEQVHSKIKKDTKGPIVSGVLDDKDAEMKNAWRMEESILEEDYLVVDCFKRQTKFSCITLIITSPLIGIASPDGPAASYIGLIAASAAMFVCPFQVIKTKFQIHELLALSSGEYYRPIEKLYQIPTETTSHPFKPIVRLSSMAADINCPSSIGLFLQFWCHQEVLKQPMCLLDVIKSRRMKKSLVLVDYFELV
ncbi:NAD+ transporter 1 [Actinidia rufa]|uniref:NAD+ transporter 1 n=1 Tax=Actinidia rufa TaxID=165716 RepID=A0A7J0EQI2_9ERIC|nr:NAD+ transporter 1 [Actinidia rufa]